jgi:hypothetical protein
MSPKKARPKSITEYINAALKGLERNSVKCVPVFAPPHPAPRKA